MIKKRIQVYADPEIKRRIELAAARRDMPVTQYCLNAIRQKLAEGDMLERETVETPIKQAKNEVLIANLRALREEILASRGGKLIDVDRVLDQLREERDQEILDLL
jgi:uncharacterized protein (DUF1778 family)